MRTLLYMPGVVSPMRTLLYMPRVASPIKTLLYMPGVVSPMKTLLYMPGVVSSITTHVPGAVIPIKNTFICRLIYNLKWQANSKMQRQKLPVKQNNELQLLQQ